MEHNFFKAVEPGEYGRVLENFEAALKEYEGAAKTGSVYLELWQKNLPAFQSLAAAKKTARWTQAYTALWRQVKDLYILSPSRYHSGKAAIFDEEEIKYINYFRITNKRVLAELESSPVADEQSYFRKFLSVSTLFCKAFGYTLSVQPATKEITVTKTDAGKDGHNTTYYLFYNRSAEKKMGIGIGKVLINGRTASIDYYYKSKDGKKPYEFLTTAGEITHYQKAAIMVLRHVRDTEDNEYGKQDGPVESFYVLKRSKDYHEKLMVGILTTWNRDKNYPVSSAVILIEKNHYDDQFAPGKPSGFNIEKMVNSREILPRITYFLRHQTVSLESVIDLQTDPSINRYQPFTHLGQVPFYRTQASALPLVTGQYQGLSILPSRDGHLLVLSELIIHKSGRVELNTANAGAQQQPYSVDNTGFIKLIETRQDLQGSLMISFKYDFKKRHNALNHVLEFRIKGPNQPTDFLKGAFAGESLLTREPVAATVIFEKVHNPGTVTIENFAIDEQDHHSLARLTELYNAHKSLFQFFHKDTDRYTNHLGVDFLRKALPLGQKLGIKATLKRQFDFFISIPLSSPKNETEYRRNAKLALQLRSELAATFQINPDNIYCSCLEGARTIDYQTYTDNSNSEAAEILLQILELAKVLILVYPKRMNRRQTAISSSLIEVGFAIGTKKKILVFYDDSERNNLPKSLMHLSAKHSFKFKTNNVNPFHKMFHNDNENKRMTDLLL